MSSVGMTAVPEQVESRVDDLKQAEVKRRSDGDISVRTVAITAACLLALALCVLALGSYLLNQRLKTSAPQSGARAAAVMALLSRSC